MSTYRVEVRRTIEVEAVSPYMAVHEVLGRNIPDLTEYDIYAVSELVPQGPLNVPLSSSSWREAVDDEGEGLGRPIMQPGGDR